VGNSFASIERLQKLIDDLGKKFVCELEEFFVNYHRLSKEESKVIAVKGPKEARKRIKDGIRAAR
jgi:inorganic pyrophosphatase